MTIRLDDTIALVTGAAGGIGRAVCQALKDAGARVIATDLSERADVPAEAYFPHDVADPADWQRIAAHIDGKYGRLDALVNVAAIVAVDSIANTTLETWRKIQSVNVESILIGTQSMLELLKKSGKTRKGGASIVNFSSVGGLRGAAFASAYCTSKGAVTLFSKSAAIEFGVLGYNIRVNSVHPGAIKTDMIHSMMRRYVELGGVPSIGDPAEIGDGVVYLCSTASSFVTGTEFVIDGGFTAV
jgi:NAD(P)-dependent dehydrogenase (short-subunit alcohol dehydrogenase family)